jgi:sialate O-acetylesterase
VLVLGRIDDEDAVYLNGKLLGKNGTFPPYPETAYDRLRKYPIPDGYLNENGENVIAIRVYDSEADGGIVAGPIGLFYDSDTELLNVNLTGKWRINEGDNKEWRNPAFNDSNWKRILVPSAWEGSALGEYDGYAWYRVHFRIPDNFKPGNDLYLMLGKIDDVDDVYLNGKYVGSVYDIKRRRDWGDGWEWNVQRAYRIQGSLLKPGELNVLAIRVYDGQGAGGIYEGPVGFMTEKNYHLYKDKHHNEGTFWDFLFYKVFED